MNVVFRVDASLKMGSGHVIRCLTLAKVLKEGGANVEFICRKHKGNLIGKICSNDFNVFRLDLPTKKIVDNSLFHSDWLEVTQLQDADDCINVLKIKKTDWLIVDHYSLDKNWQSKVKPYYKKLMVIDDLADREHQCDILLDQNLVVDMNSRYNHLVNDSCHRLLGPKFSLLQPIYGKLHGSANKRTLIKRIIISFGGCDNHNLTELFIRAFVNLNIVDIHVDVVLSKSSPNFKSVKNRVKGYLNIHLYSDLPSLAELMANSDLSIGASGATTWERLCLRLPSIVTTLAHNQEAVAHELHSRGLIHLIGSNKDVTIEKAERAIRYIIEQYRESSQMLEMHKIIDGMGSIYVSNTIFKLME
jgi:UDP-2,4-diacetamido-2,4,6-trideoxy-beta-L-altropyranose hydrolase